MKHFFFIAMLFMLALTGITAARAESRIIESLPTEPGFKHFAMYCNGADADTMASECVKAIKAECPEGSKFRLMQRSTEEESVKWVAVEVICPIGDSATKPDSDQGI